MKVLHVLPSLDPVFGGPLKVANDLKRGCRDKFDQINIFPEEETKRGIPTLAYYPGLKALTRLKELISVNDIIHIHGIWNIPNSFAALWARRLGKPYIIRPAGMLDRWAMQRSKLKKAMYMKLFEKENINQASSLHFLNDQELEESLVFGFKSPAFVLPNGIFIEEYDDLPPKEVLEKRYPEIKESILILFLGRIHPKKGLELLVSTLPDIRSEVSNIHLMIAGPDEKGHKKSIMKLVKKHFVEDIVTFTGMVTGELKKAILGAADIFVLPSYQEGDSLSVKEAMASSIPVIISRACHFPQVDKGKAGFVIDTHREDLILALNLLCKNKNKRREFGRNGRGIIEESFMLDPICESLAQIYKDILFSRFSSSNWRIY